MTWKKATLRTLIRGELYHTEISFTEFNGNHKWLLKQRLDSLKKIIKTTTTILVAETTMIRI